MNNHFITLALSLFLFFGVEKGHSTIQQINLARSTLDLEDTRLLKEIHQKTYNKITRKQRLNLQDIRALSKAEITDEKILQILEQTRTKITLSNHEIILLQSEGVSFKVINYLIQKKSG